MRRPLRNWPTELIAEKVTDLADEAAELSNRTLAIDRLTSGRLSRMCRDLHQIACRVKETGS